MYFREEFYFGLNSTSGSTFISRPPLARDLVSMAEDDPAPGRVTAGVATIARAAGTESDLRIGRCNLRYGLDLSRFLLPAIIDKFLTNLGKFAQTAEARK